MRRLLLSVSISTVLLTGLSGRSDADGLPAFEFRGHHIGEPIDTNFPYWEKGSRGLGQNFKPLPYCSKKDNGTVICNDMTVDDIGGAQIMGFDYHFFDGKLFSLNMGFYNTYYEKIRGLLEGKYGKPTAVYSEPIQNLAGAHLDNIVTEWRFQEGVLKLHWRFAKMYLGHLGFENPIVDHEIYTRDTQRLQAQGKKAF